MPPKVTPADNGPLIVEGLSRLTRLGSAEAYETRERFALCRCGRSANKPFCDGTHTNIGFSDAKLDGRTPDVREDFVGERITIHDNRGICAHSGVCTDRLATVFRYGQEPWIAPDGAAAEDIKAVIEACPSGALSYSVDGVEQKVDTGSPQILVAPKGPYAVRGQIELVGQSWGAGARKDCYDLCRCGQSKNKPFCDGSHWHVEFDEQAED